MSVTQISHRQSFRKACIMCTILIRNGHPQGVKNDFSLLYNFGGKFYLGFLHSLTASTTSGSQHAKWSLDRIEKNF